MVNKKKPVVKLDVFKLIFPIWLSDQIDQMSKLVTGLIF